MKQLTDFIVFQIFNEEYKRLTMNLSISTLKDALENKNFDLPMKILQSQCNLLENKTIPISLDAVDTILGCLMEIKIQGLSASSEKIPNNFRHICRQMMEMCQALIKHRPIFLMDRMPQYTHVIKNLIQSIVWYKCERQKDVLLPDEELSEIAELALKLETLMKSIAEQEQAIAVKRIAPFLLLFIIHLIVSNKRPITLYNKVYSMQFPCLSLHVYPYEIFHRSFLFFIDSFACGGNLSCLDSDL